jgi:hypothetical protein
LFFANTILLLLRLNLYNSVMMLKIHKQGIPKTQRINHDTTTYFFDLKWFRLTFIDHNCIIRLRKLSKEEITDEFNSYSN